MFKSVLVSASLLTLAAGCEYALGTTGQDTSFERVGTLNCTTGTPSEQAFAVGTARDPVRCGPQSQPVE
ncbi:hypothetical protein FHS72_002022 [Loktanella ponticola]|uniref:Uncharacterized protein n=1 Tax=Yoonia ponticola TaxID=1524255 RepID=A0A7W9EZY2_9RHOB|nr:hypothetical protein [Yoonia ponticola]MBB5722396.1 hypothetical protein [Yoonia ponticola]